MAIRSSTTSAAAHQSPLPDYYITPVEDRFTEMLDCFDRAEMLEEALDARNFGDPAYAVSFALADAALAKAFELLDTVIRLEDVTPFCSYLQYVARLMRDAMADEEPATIEEILEGTVLRQRLWPLYAPYARQRRTLMLVDHAMRVLEAQAPRLASTLIARPAPSDPSDLPSAA